LNDTYCVMEPTPLTYTTVTIPSYCGGANGEAMVTGVGGSTPYTYLWPDGQTTATATNLVAGVTYNFTLSDANGCSVIIPIVVTDDPAPAISVSALGVQCFGLDNGQATVVVDSLGTPQFTYLWDDTLNQTTATAVDLVGDTTYNVIVTDANNCSATMPIYVPENPELTLIAAGDDTICYGDSIEISVTGSGGFSNGNYLYGWSNGVNTQTQWVSPGATTTYTVYIEDDAGCRSEDSGMVTVSVLPPLSLTASPQVICDGDSVYLNAVAGGATGGPYTYSWSNGINDSDQTIFGLSNDTSFTITVSDACPKDTTVTVNVTVNPVPDVTVLAEGEGCEPYVLSVDIGQQGGTPVPIVSWLWDFGDGGTSTDPDSTVHLYTVAGTYQVSLVIVSDQGCVATVYSSTMVSAYGLPVAGFDITQGGVILDPTETTILTPTIDFLNTADSIAAWFWDFGDPNSESGNNSTDENPSHMYSDTGTYTVMQVVMTADSCFDTAYGEVTITGDYIIFAPNAFTPDGDGDNDFFFPKGTGVSGESFKLFIFDRWGDLIAEVTGIWSDDLGVGWDGHANYGDEEAQQDVYIWLIRTEDYRGDNHEYVGHVTLLR
jgi:gliding motility-associated-like protein